MWTVVVSKGKRLSFARLRAVRCGLIVWACTLSEKKGKAKPYGPASGRSDDMIWRVADQVGPPTVRLTVRILEQAIRDWKKPSKPAEKTAQQLGYSSLQQELVAFFSSDWCRDILQLLDCDHLDILELLRQGDNGLDASRGGSRAAWGEGSR